MTYAIEKNSGGQVCFGRRQKALTFKQKAVLRLMDHCVCNLIILDEYILQDWFMEKIIKPRNKMIDGKYLGYKTETGRNAYERILEYDLRKRQIAEKGGLMDHWHLNEAKQTLKSCIGSLVVRGYLTAIPNIKMRDIPDLISE